MKKSLVLLVALLVALLEIPAPAYAASDSNCLEFEDNISYVECSDGTQCSETNSSDQLGPNLRGEGIYIAIEGEERWNSGWGEGIPEPRFCSAVMMMHTTILARYPLNWDSKLIPQTMPGSESTCGGILNQGMKIAPDFIFI